MEYFITFVESLARGIEYLGVLIVAISAIIAVVRLLQNIKNLSVIRRQFAEWIMTGLEFIIAAEIIFATLVSGREELIVLGAVVIIRILLGFALKKEII